MINIAKRSATDIGAFSLNGRNLPEAWYRLFGVVGAAPNRPENIDEV